MEVRPGEQGRLYGSVTSADIAEKAGEILGGGWTGDVYRLTCDGQD